MSHANCRGKRQDNAGGTYVRTARSPASSLERLDENNQSLAVDVLVARYLRTCITSSSAGRVLAEACLLLFQQSIALVAVVVVVTASGRARIDSDADVAVDWKCACIFPTLRLRCCPHPQRGAFSRHFGWLDSSHDLHLR